MLLSLIKLVDLVSFPSHLLVATLLVSVPPFSSVPPLAPRRIDAMTKMSELPSGLGLSLSLRYEMDDGLRVGRKLPWRIQVEENKIGGERRR